MEIRKILENHLDSYGIDWKDLNSLLYELEKSYIKRSEVLEMIEEVKKEKRYYNGFGGSDHPYEEEMGYNDALSDLSDKLKAGE